MKSNEYITIYNLVKVNAKYAKADVDEGLEVNEVDEEGL